jgi:hypothetical protein
VPKSSICAFIASSAKIATTGGGSVTNKQLYTLCGVITLSAAYITNSTFLGVFAFLWFVSSIVAKD